VWWNGVEEGGKAGSNEKVVVNVEGTTRRKRRRRSRPAQLAWAELSEAVRWWKWKEN
jgi:hypothetical protein